MRGVWAATDADRVRLQPDGLHVDATNVADATMTAIEPVDGHGDTIEHAFEMATETFVADVDPGEHRVGCRLPDEEGEVLGGPAEFPDRYVQVTVLPADA